MNCDDAFDALTNPETRQSEELRWHLHHCPRCRAMEETLAPALDLFADSRTQTPSRELFADEAPLFLTQEALALAEQTAASLKQSVVQPETRRPRKFWLRYTVAALLCISAGIFFAQGILPRSAAGVPDNVCHWKQPDRTTQKSSQLVVLSCVSCHLPNQTFKN